MKHRLTSFYRRNRFVLSVVAILFLFVFGSAGLVVVNGETLEPNDSHVVSLYVDGRSYDVPTRAKSVAEFLEKTHITLGESDIVEPSKDSKIEVDLFRIRVSRARPYIVRDGSRQLAALSAHTTPRLIAEAAGLTLKPADKVDFMPIDSASTTGIGRLISVERSKEVSVSLYGSLQKVNTNAATVADLLSELHITPAADDEISPLVSADVLDGTSVFINRKGVKVVTEEVAIQPETTYVTDNELTLGSTAVRDPGKPGKKVVTYQIMTQNEVEVGRTEISSVIVEQPVTKVVARGRAAGQIGAERQELMAAAGISPDEYGAADFIIGHESGWCATKWQGQWGQCPSFYEEKYPGAETVGSLGFGLCQSTPAIKMASAGADWRTNPVTQLKWCTGYAIGRYGSWTNAYEFWAAHSWW
jgi:uncharacterized protein YabE (DUF348 family)